ncbi:uncharacterized protein LOC128161263 [Crassostrea angulata]|uniref:uncharacterized protein LOC128161263 n=1 Tax=Magallana angulata TaxID=2784310 RepID=UPI0022B1B07E|nr:uncharacterized protein LOC128161263 [Crassostrea angulata]
MSLHTDGCGNRGLMWQCGNRNLSEIPEHIPLKYKGEFVTLDLSKNQFTRITMETFHNIDPRVRSRITSISLRNNPIRYIGNFSFQCLWRLCELDLSTCHLQRTSFEINSFGNSLLNQLKILRLHNNSFRGNGYPDTAISKAKLLENLTLDVFGGFTFSSYFQNLTKLKKIEFITGNSKFHLTNSTFRGLIKSPIVNLEMIFKFRVYSDVSDDIFCSFPFLKAVHIEFGGMCDLNVVLKSLKCLQHRTMDRIVAYNNNPMIAKNAVYLDNENCKYLFNICSRRVELIKNRIVGIYDNLLSTVMGQCMEYFDVSSNRIRVINPWYMLDFLTRYPNLQVFNFSSNADQCNCESPGYSHRPTLAALRMIDCENDKFSQIASNMFVSNVSGKTYLKKRGLMAFKISEKIRVLHFSKNYLNRLTYPLPFDISLNAMNLKELYVVRTNFPCKYMAPIQTPFLEILDISNNDCSEMKMRILMFAKKLRIFVASNIKLSFAGSLKYGKLFRGVMSLCKVDLSRNSLIYLPPAMFKDQENLY